MNQKLKLNEVYHYLKKSQANNFQSLINREQDLKDIKTILEEEFGWPLDFIEFHSKNIEYPFREITNIIYNVHDFLPPVKKNVMHRLIQMDEQPLQSRIKKYDDYITGKAKKYYRHNDEHPMVYIKKVLDKQYDQVHPITVVDLGNNFKFEPLDGGHRITLAKMYNLTIPAWILVYKEDSGCSYGCQKIRNLIGE